MVSRTSGVASAGPSAELYTHTALVQSYFYEIEGVSSPPSPHCYTVPIPLHQAVLNHLEIFLDVPNDQKLIDELSNFLIKYLPEDVNSGDIQQQANNLYQTIIQCVRQESIDRIDSNYEMVGDLYQRVVGILVEAVSPAFGPQTPLVFRPATNLSVTDPSVIDPSVTDPSVTDPSVTDPSVTYANFPSVSFNNSAEIQDDAKFLAEFIIHAEKLKYPTPAFRSDDGASCQLAPSNQSCNIL